MKHWRDVHKSLSQVALTSVRSCGFKFHEGRKTFRLPGKRVLSLLSPSVCFSNLQENTIRHYVLKVYGTHLE